MTKIVLCVDDSATMQQVADITFRGTEFSYVGARSFDEGLDKARSQKPTVILADSTMPNKTGYDLCLALKNDPGTANIPIVILIGNGAPYDSARGVAVGADANLPKPWDTQTMLERVGEVVAKAATGVARPGQAPVAAPAATTSQPVPIATAASTSKSAPAATPPASATSSASMPPRSATIMGMPTIKMPAGVAPTATPPVPAKTSVMAVPPIAPPTNNTSPAPAGLRAPAAITSAPSTGPLAAPSTGPLAVSAAGPAAAAAVAPAPAPLPSPLLSTAPRPPLVTATPTKRSALVERSLAKMAARLAEAANLEPGSPELLALLKLSTEVVERIVWEVVPDLAEQIIRENLHDLTARRS